MPPGDVTLARSRLRALGRLVEQPGRADEELAHERLARVPGQPDEHPGVDERLGHEEEVRRT